MKKVKKSYIIIFALIIFAVICFGASYAIFVNINEQHGKLNIVVGDLTYKLESDDLLEHKITVAANSEEEIVIYLTSLNEIDSKYELYYLLDQENENIEVGYSADTEDSVLGTISANEMKKITVIIKNNSDTESTIEFSVIGGLVNNELVLSDGNSLDQELQSNLVMKSTTELFIGMPVTAVDGSKWHVLEASDENSNTVVLLSDYNLNTDGSYNTECGRDINSTYDCSGMSFDPNTTNTYDEEDSNNIAYFIKNTYEPIVTVSLPGTTDVTLPTAEQIAIASNKTFSQSGFPLIRSSWFLTTNYWTKTAITSGTGAGFYINGNDSYIYGAAAYYSYGARPVITTLKSNLLPLQSITTDTALAVGNDVIGLDGSTWRVLESSESGIETVTLLSDYNLNTDGSYNTECGRDINSTYKCSTVVFDSDGTSTYDELDDNNIGYFIKNIYSPLITASLPGTTNVTIPTTGQIAAVDGLTFSNAGGNSNTSLTSEWLKRTDYWTQSSLTNSTLYVWSAYGTSSNIHYVSSNSADCGVRAVITTLKSNLLDQ